MCLRTLHAPTHVFVVAFVMGLVELCWYGLINARHTNVSSELRSITKDINRDVAYM